MDRIIKKAIEKEGVKEVLSLLKKAKNWDYVRNNLSQKSREEFQEGAYHKRLKDYIETVDFLNKKGLNFVVLRGLSLFEVQKDRTMFDLDIFAGRNETEKTAEILKNQFGYEYNQDELIDYKLRLGHHITLKHPTRLPIEIHYYLFDFFYNAQNLLEKKSYINIEGVLIPCLEREMQIVTMLLHPLYNHGFDVDYTRLHNDINSIVGYYQIDWNRFKNIVRELDCEATVFTTIKLSEYFTGKKINFPKDVLSHLEFGSSAIKLYFTKNLKSDLEDPKKRALLSTQRVRLEKILLFNFGFNLRFTKLLSVYLKIPAKKVYINIDRNIGKIGSLIREYSPKLYYKLKKAKR